MTSAGNDRGDGGSGELPESPCIRHCCLDEADVCLGCGRHIDEITGWHGADAPTRLVILERARRRREQRAQRWPGP